MQCKTLILIDEATSIESHMSVLESVSAAIRKADLVDGHEVKLFARLDNSTFKLAYRATKGEGETIWKPEYRNREVLEQQQRICSMTKPGMKK